MAGVPPWRRFDRWPNGVETYADMLKFCEMMTGRGSTDPGFHDLTTLLDPLMPDHERFLILMKASPDAAGGSFTRAYSSRDQPRAETGYDVPAFSEETLVTHCEALHSNVRVFEQEIRQNWSNPDKGLKIGGAIENYLSTQLCKGTCTCYVSFGGDGKVKWGEYISAVASQAGTSFQRCLQNHLEWNLMKMEENPQDIWWTQEGSTWHCLFNFSDLQKGHGIDFHPDRGYAPIDPISGITLMHGAPLIVRNASVKGRDRIACVLVMQNPGDILMMGGKFQSCFEHMVPQHRLWQKLLTMARALEQGSQRLHEKLDTEKNHFLSACVGTTDLERTLVRDTENPSQMKRWNVTIRWHRGHNGRDCALKGRDKTVKQLVDEYSQRGPPAPTSEAPKSDVSMKDSILSVEKQLRVFEDAEGFEVPEEGSRAVMDLLGTDRGPAESGDSAVPGIASSAESVTVDSLGPASPVPERLPLQQTPPWGGVSEEALDAPPAASGTAEDTEMLSADALAWKERYFTLIKSLRTFYSRAALVDRLSIGVLRQPKPEPQVALLTKEVQWMHVMQRAIEEIPLCPELHSLADTMAVYFDAMMTRKNLVSQSPPSLSPSANAMEATAPGGAVYAKPCAFTTVELRRLYHMTKFVSTPKYGIVVQLLSSREDTSTRRPITQLLLSISEG